MTKKKKKNKTADSKAKKLVMAIIILLIAVGWEAYNSHIEQARDASKHISQIDSLLMVNTPQNVTAELLNYHGFTVSFNKDYRQPNWVAWELTAEESRANASKREDGTFAPDPRVDGCPTLDDYRNSGYDRGHMCPAGDMKWSPEAMAACFYLTNMSPQVHALNNGTWKTLEEKCRSWAIRDSALIIICGPVLSDRMPRSIGANRVPVPERFFKVVLAPFANPPRGIGFIMPNAKVDGGMQATAVSIDQVEAITGFDFFAALPDELESQIEAECDFPEWNKKRR